MNKKNDTYDSPWKEIIEFFFHHFMSFFVPGSEDDIDWGKKIKFLDKELQQLTKKSVIGQKNTDKLIEVTLKQGIKKWILIHIEVQSQRNSDFPERMFVYNYRIYDRYKIPVTSIAILADDSPSWHPVPFHYGMWGSSMGLDYLKTKLLDYQDRWQYLTEQDNPFSIVVMAHLKALETKNNHSLRKQWKTQLTKLLYEKGYSETGIINLYGFIDWVLTLPEALEELFVEELKAYEKEKNMSYITSAERIGERKGREEGREEGRKEGRKEGEKRGEKNTQIEIVLRMLRKGFELNTICELTGISLEEVQKEKLRLKL